VLQTQPRSTELRPQTAWLLVAIGLALRLAGLPFKGTHDLDQLVLEWGASVEQYGLAHTPIIIYGVLSYVFHGLAFWLAESVPRFWWAPQKLFEIGAELGIYFALKELVPPSREKTVIWLYWLNPFFILSGAWLGFWDGPYTLAGLLAVLAFRAIKREQTRWLAVGAILAAGAMFKPQGLIYFLVPVFLYASWNAVFSGRLSALSWLALGAFGSFGAAAAGIALLGGDPLAIPQSYLIGGIMPNLCNSCISIWRPITRILQVMLGQTGPLYDLRLPSTLYQMIDRLILLGTMILVTSFVAHVAKVTERNEPNEVNPTQRIGRLLRWTGMSAFAVGLIGLLHRSDAKYSPHLVAGLYSASYARILGAVFLVATLGIIAGPAISRYAANAFLRKHNIQGSIGARPAYAVPEFLAIFLVLAFAALVIPQLATRAHISHTYAGLVMLVPLAAVQPRLRTAWMLMASIHFYGYASSYGIGASTALPNRDVSSYPQMAHTLVSRIDASSFPGIIRFQSTMNDWIHAVLPTEPWLSFLSLIQFCCVLYIVVALFRNTAWIRQLDHASSSSLIRFGHAGPSIHE
jgi:hypothetical protein